MFLVQLHENLYALSAHAAEEGSSVVMYNARIAPALFRHPTTVFSALPPLLSTISPQGTFHSCAVLMLGESASTTEFFPIKCVLQCRDDARHALEESFNVFERSDKPKGARSQLPRSIQGCPSMQLLDRNEEGITACTTTGVRRILNEVQRVLV